MSALARIAGILLPAMLAVPAATAPHAPGAPHAVNPLPPCRATAGPSTRPPDSGPSTRAGCRAQPRHTATGPAPSPSTGERPGYHHLGAVTDDGWSGATARFTVRATGVRSGSNDFVAGRLMVRGDAGGRTHWLETGWSTDGWLSSTAPHVYSYDSNRSSWAFYDQYKVADGDRLYFGLTAGSGTGADTTWNAWLWWDNRWNLLTAQSLPITARADIEQYVEVYVDPKRGGGYRVPGVDVTDVRLGADGDYRPWRDDGSVVTTAAAPDPGWCLTWRTRYDDWTAGSC